MSTLAPSSWIVGFGFIVSTGGKSIFFHKSDLSAHLPIDKLLLLRTVQFEIQEAERGQKAVKIHPAD